ncbi:polyketide synthase [Planctomycetales bacterium]|nr:polyketide synthase [Planctomycetales bacterium]
MVLLATLAAFGVLVWKIVLRRYWTNIASETLAGLIEKYVPSLNGSLVTAVRHQDETDIDADLLQRTIQVAAANLRNVRLKPFFRRSRFAGLIFFALVILANAAGFTYLFQSTAAIWFSRNVLLSSDEYPRRSFLEIEGFQDGKVRICRGDSLTLIIRADTSMPLVPEMVRLQIRSEANEKRTLLIDQFRTENQAGQTWRVFTQTLPDLLENQTLQIRGADTVLDHLQIEVLPPPMLTDLKLHQTFPDYMKRPSRSVPVSGRMPVPDGTSIEITGAATKPLAEWTLQDHHGNHHRNKTPGENPGDASENKSNLIRTATQQIRDDSVFQFSLTDTDGLQNRQVIQAELAVVKDQPPQVTTRLDGIGAAITPEAILPVQGEMTDDYGLAAATFRWSVREAEKDVEKSTDKNTDNDTEKNAENTKNTERTGQVTILESSLSPDQTSTLFTLPQTQTFDVSLLKTKPGDRLALFIDATDHFNLDASSGQNGEGTRWTLEIVSPERLKTLLEVRETGLRQRFEVVLGEVERTKSIVQPDEYNVSRTLRDTQKEVYDLRGIADAFRLIRQEMVNNRIFSDDVKFRLDGGIINPIQELITADFPELDKLIEKLVRQPATLNDIQQRFDVLVEKMKKIRDNMISMESFNEAIELLRAIIKEQQQIRNETIQEKNNRLKKLLE